MTANTDLVDLKIEIKTWENEFSKENNRNPTKEDLDVADDRIKSAYRNYYKLKKSRHASEKPKSPTEITSAWNSSLNKGNDRKDKPSRSTDNRKPGCYKKILNNLRKDSLNIFPVKKSKPTSNEIINNNISDAECERGLDKKVDDNVEFKRKHITSNSIQPINQILLDNRNLQLKHKKVNFDWLKRCDPGSDVSCSKNSNCIGGENISDNKLTNNIISDKCDDNSSETSNERFAEIAVNDADSKCNVVLEIEDDKHSTLDENNKASPIRKVFCEASADISDCTTNGISPVGSSSGDDKETTNFVPRNKRSATEENDANMSGKRLKVLKSENKPENLIKNIKDTKVESSRLSYSSLERKVAAGTQNDNFVRINLKRKKFSRGHKHISSKNYKLQKWKQLKSGQKDNKKPPKSSSACFKCGEIGHWARNCPGIKGDTLLPMPELEEFNDDSPFPTLEEASVMARGIKSSAINPSVIRPQNYNQVNATVSDAESKLEEMDNDFDEVASQNQIAKASPIPKVQPLYDSRSPEDVNKLVNDALLKMGYTEFRPGQYSAITRILSGQSTLVVLSTGSGKSLCYQLPAYIYAMQMKCITLVISPLVSLMEDQVTGLAPCIKAACYHTNQTIEQRKKVLDSVQNGNLHVLLVSPEAIVSGSSSSGLLPSKLPPIAFACIDEAHCVSEWSHNFRPSYLRLNKVLKESFAVTCVLGLTATATVSTIRSIAHHMNIQDTEEAIIRGFDIPNNLVLSGSRDLNREQSLLNLLKGERFSSCDSVIIYCTRREVTERLATLIRTAFQEADEINCGVKKRGRTVSSLSEAYHAGLSAARRKSVQNQFMCGKLKIVVATVAFGMGLDKPDVRAIIHYNMPKSFESYVQEIGRAGRDGLTSHCHYFLDTEGNDTNELKRHIYGNTVDRHAVRKLIQRIFSKDCVCKNGGKCNKHEVAISIEKTVEELDIKEENIATLLCYLELHPKQWLEIMNPAYSNCKLSCYGGVKQLKSIAHKSPPIAAAVALRLQNQGSMKNATSIEFPVVEVCSKMGWESGIVKRELKNLEWNNDLIRAGHKAQRTGIVVEFFELSFHFKSVSGLDDEELDEVLDFLHNRLVVQERYELYQLNQVYQALSGSCHANYSACSDKANEQRSNKLKELLREYFNKKPKDPAGNTVQLMFGNETTLPLQDELKTTDGSQWNVDDIRADIKNLICTHRDHSFTGRAVARIFHGITSPCFPAQVWGRVRRYWRSHLSVDFNFLVDAANQEILKFK